MPLDVLDRQDNMHGTACAMIIYGIAPDADLYLAQFDSSSQDSWLQALQFLLANNVHIIEYSTGSAIGPRDGTFGESVIVDQVVRESNVLWVSAAGDESPGHTAFQYHDNGQGLHAFSAKVTALPFVAFAPTTTVVMNWNGNWQGGEQGEYTFTILDADQKEVVTAAEPKEGRKDDFPFQAATFATQPKSIYYLVIHRVKSAGDNFLDVFIDDAVFPDWAQSPDRSITVPGDAVGALTVGATLLTDQPTVFSSQGPTPDSRLKPDLVAPTGEPLPGYESGFAGTAGAAAVAAGASSLVLQSFPEMKAEEVKAFLIANVKDLGPKGPDPQFGAGRLALPDPGAASSAPDRSAAPPAARITDVEVQYNVKVRGQKGLAIAVSFEVHNFKSGKGRVGVLFVDVDGKPLPTGNAKYRILGKGLGVDQPFTARRDPAVFDDVLLFIPYTAFDQLVPNTTQLYYRATVVSADNPGTPLAQSDPVAIKINK